MPSFSGFKTQETAKGAVMSDGEIFKTSASGSGHTVPVFPSSYSAFKGVPVRSGTGVWSVTMRDPAFKVLYADVKPMTTTANYVGVIMQPNTTNSVGQLVINWTFVTVGTSTAADIAASQLFEVYVVYSEASIA